MASLELVDEVLVVALLGLQPNDSVEVSLDGERLLVLRLFVVDDRVAEVLPEDRTTDGKELTSLANGVVAVAALDELGELGDELGDRVVDLEARGRPHEPEELPDLRLGFLDVHRHSEVLQGLRLVLILHVLHTIPSFSLNHFPQRATLLERKLNSITQIQFPLSQRLRE